MARLIALLALGVAVYVWWRGPRALERLRAALLPGLAILFSLLYARSPIDVVPDTGPVGLLDDLLVLLWAFWWARRSFAQGRGRPHERTSRTERADAAPAWNPHAVLGVARGASREEIRHAYREQLKRYHPDRVNGLGEELERLAHHKTVEIQRAYRELTAE